MIAFDIKYKKRTSAEPRIYKNVIICGSFGSEEEGSNIGYQALMPEIEGTEPMRPQTSNNAGSVDLGDPNDSGVNIDSILGNASDIWKAIK